MILKLFLMQTSYFIISKSEIYSYVLFAANIDDFKSIANKIIPGRLLDQIADIASKPKDVKYRHEKYGVENSDVQNHSTENHDKESSEEDENEKTFTQKFDDETHTTPKPLWVVDRDDVSTKIFNLNDEYMDLEELVRRVKEKLENEYKVIAKSQEKEGQVDVTEEGEKEDYYYKDANLNLEFDNNEYEQMEKHRPSLIFTTRKPNYGAQYDDQTLENNSGYPTNDAIKFAEDNLKEKVTRNEKIYYKETANEASQRYHDKENIKYMPEYKQKHAKEEHMSGNFAIANVSEDAEYYEDNSKDVPIDQKRELFKEVNMQNSKDSYEDYVTPKRDHKFDSIEATTEKTFKHKLTNEMQQHSAKYNEHKLSKLKAVLDPVNIERGGNDVGTVLTKKVITLNPPQVNVKGRISENSYKDHNIQSHGHSNHQVTVNKRTTKHLRTNIPTRTLVKISSPNYFVKLPAVAEKYNFDEPIPEKDREREKIKI